MKIIHKDIKKGEIKLKVENPDDLWYLSSIIEPNDLLSGSTLRKISAGDDAKSATRRRVFLEILVEKINYAAESSTLRIGGKITQGPEDVPKGSYHTFNIEENSIIRLTKQEWLSYQLSRLNEASQKQPAKILIVAMDRDSVIFALMKKYGFEILAEFEGDVQKKYVAETKKETFYNDIISKMKDYVQRHGIHRIILGSPIFWKENLLKEIDDDELRKRIILASCSSATKTGINEILKRPEVKEAIKQERAAEEINKVEELLTRISKDGNYAYGITEVEKAVGAGAAEELLVTYSFIQKVRDENNYERLDRLMRAADKMKAKIMVISSENDGGRKLDGLGGIAALLRFKVNW